MFGRGLRVFSFHVCFSECCHPNVPTLQLAHTCFAHEILHFRFPGDPQTSALRTLCARLEESEYRISELDAIVNEYRPPSVPRKAEKPPVCMHACVCSCKFFCVCNLLSDRFVAANVVVELLQLAKVRCRLLLNFKCGPQL